METMNAIDSRYSALAKTTTCLSCGGAINHGNPTNAEICVDLGSGRGNDCIKLAQKVGPEGFVYGIDISDGMLETARSRAFEEGITNVAFHKSPIDHLPLKENSIDLLISNCTINHAANKDAVWTEIFRVLRPGGRFVVSDIYSLEPIAAEYRNDPAAVAQCWAGAVTKTQYLETLASIGFSSIELLEESRPYEKGKVTVASVTIRGYKPLGS